MDGADDLHIVHIHDALKQIGDELDQRYDFFRIASSIAQESYVRRQYSDLARLIREFVMMVSFNRNVPDDLVKRAIRIFLFMWNNKELSGQIMQELNADISVNIPQEVEGMNDDVIHKYHEALRCGEERVRHIRLMVVGMFEVGKTSLVKNIVENEMNVIDTNVEPESTTGIDVKHYTIRCDGKWVENILDNCASGRFIEVMSHIGNDSLDGHDETTIIDDRQGHIDTAPRSTADDNTPQDEAIDLFKDKLVNSLANNNDPDLNVFINAILRELNEPREAHTFNPTVSIWDFAGQNIYYSTHHFFLNSRSIYLLLMDISRPLDSFVKETSDFSMSGFLHKDFTCIEAFKFWLCSIHMYNSKQIHGSDIHPCVILVATHKDKLSGSDVEKERQKEDYFNEALKSLKDTPVLQHVHRKKFLVNNLDSNEAFESIREEVLKLAMKHRYWGERRPAKWIPLERSLGSLKAEGKEIISFEELRIKNQKNELPIESDLDLRLFLQFQHSIGNVLYYETDILKNFIILTPQWIIDAFRCFVTHVPDKDPMKLTLWEDYEKKAVLSAELIDEIIDKNKYFRDNKKVIIKYMEHLDMMARPPKQVLGLKMENSKDKIVEGEYNGDQLRTELERSSGNADGLETDFIECVTSRLQKQDILPVSSFNAAQCCDSVPGDINASAAVADFYIVPLLLKSTPKKSSISTLINPDCILKTPVLCIVFSDGFMPPSIFHRLLAVCIRRWTIVEQDEQCLLFNGLAVFYIDTTSTLSVWFHDNIIYARVFFYDKINEALCTQIQQFLTQNLKAILSILPRESRIIEIMPFEEYIQCSRITQFEPGKGMLKLRDFVYNDTQRCSCLEIHTVSKFQGLRFWCNNFIKKQNDSSIPKCTLQRRPSTRELGRISQYIGDEYFRLGLELDLSTARLQQIRATDRYHLPTRIYHMLFACCNKSHITVEVLRNAMIASDSDIESFEFVFGDSDLQPSDALDRYTGVKFSRYPEDKELSSLASGIGDEYWLLGIELGITETDMHHLRHGEHDMTTLTYRMLLKWKSSRENLKVLGMAMLLVRMDMKHFAQVFSD